MQPITHLIPPPKINTNSQICPLSINRLLKHRGGKKKKSACCLRVLLLPSCLPCKQKEAGSFPSPLSLSGRDMCTYTLNTPASPGRSVCHSPTLDTPAAQCVCSAMLRAPSHLAQAPGGTHIHLHAGMTKLPSLPSFT